MSNVAIRTIALFKWTGDISELLPKGDPNRISKDDGEELTYISAQPAAKAILSALRAKNSNDVDDQLIVGEGGWHIFFNTAEKRYSLFVHWTGIENQDYFAVQPVECRGCLMSLFRRASNGDELVAAVSVLKHALSLIPTISNLRWLSAAEFDESYRLGKPLPPFQV